MNHFISVDPYDALLLHWNDDAFFEDEDDSIAALYVAETTNPCVVDFRLTGLLLED